MEQRPSLPAAQIADLQYLDLLANPVEAIESTYDQLGLPFDTRMPDRIRSYLAARPQDKHGQHRYSAADFGLDTDQIRKDFAPYTEAFNVASGVLTSCPRSAQTSPATSAVLTTRHRGSSGSASGSRNRQKIVPRR